MSAVFDPKRSALVEPPPAEDVSGIRGRSALANQTRTLGFELEDALDFRMLGGRDMGVRDRDEDLVQDVSLVKRLQHYRAALAVHVMHPEFVQETLV